jgi:16S rRNA (adenine1518-N6/adenine1519-N6)-dimethyltransferase
MSALRPKKRLGQHFLKSPDIVRKILDLIEPRADQTIVEIGPGRGALTLPLAATGAEVVAIEFDRDAARYLSRRLVKQSNLKVVNQDFLKFEPDSFGLIKFTLIGNLPFNITSPVIDWVINHHSVIERACFMVQKEMASRLTARPNSKDWSPISIFTQLHFEVVHHFDIGPEHFQPKPKVTSTVITLTPKEKILIKHPAQFEKVVRASFRHRRKLLANNLVPDIIFESQVAREILRELGLTETCRAEQLTMAQFLKLTERLIARKIL